MWRNLANPYTITKQSLILYNAHKQPVLLKYASCIRSVAVLVHSMAAPKSLKPFLVTKCTKKITVTRVHKINIKTTKKLTTLPSNIHKLRQMAALHVHTWYRPIFRRQTRPASAEPRHSCFRVTHAL